MTSSNYWAKVSRARQSRRRLLATTFSLGGAAAVLALAGCGGDGDSEGEGEGLLSPLKDTSSDAVRGGTLTANITSMVSMDPITGVHGGYKVQNGPMFNRIFQTEPGVLEASEGNIVGDVAESWELSGDGLQLTIRSRQNLGTDPRPPVNGRKLDAQDVLFSWNVFAALSTVRATLVNSVNPNSPITSVSAPDNQTLIFKLAFPSILLEGYLADGFYFWIIPKEAESQYDRRVEAHGAGPFYMEAFEQDVRFRLRRNPNYYNAELPYFDAIEVPVLIEPAAQLAQLEAKRLDLSGTVYGTAGITNDNVVEVYNRHREMTVFATPGSGSGSHLRVGYADGSPFRDLRMRKALSMSVNRDDLAEYFTNASILSGAGLPTEPVQVSHMAPIYPGALDVRDDALKASRAHLEYNPAEAKKLVQAAGHENQPFEVQFSSGVTSERTGNVMADQLRQAGHQVNERILDINTEFVQTIVRRRGDYNGVGVHLMLEGFGPEHYIYTNYDPTPETAAFRTKQDFPELTAISDAYLKERDAQKRTSLMKDWTVRAAADLPTIPVGAIGPTYHLAWPWVQNVGVYRRWLGSLVNNFEVYVHYWYDKSKDTRTT
jgi:peptide/nickel transport system substrate-binding protein